MAFFEKAVAALLGLSKAAGVAFAISGAHPRMLVASRKDSQKQLDDASHARRFVSSAETPFAEGGKKSVVTPAKFAADDEVRTVAMAEASVLLLSLRFSLQELKEHAELVPLSTHAS